MLVCFGPVRQPFFLLGSLRQPESRVGQATKHPASSRIGPARADWTAGDRGPDVLMVDTQRAVCLVPRALLLAIKLRHPSPVVLRACL